MTRREGLVPRATNGSPEAGGQGRLAEVLASRGGRAESEALFVIEHREALIYMLCEAAELEHGIMCQYLFAAFSLKQRADEGLTPEQLEAVTRWRRTIAHVAASHSTKPACTRAPLSGGREPNARALRRAGLATLHVPRAPGGHGAQRR